MSRFAANIDCLFTEMPRLERPAAAARAGFAAVEALFPYDTPAHLLRAEVERHGLKMLGVNTAYGEAELSGPVFGLGAVPGRERDFEALFAAALDYVVAAGGVSVHCLAGKVDPGERANAARVFAANLSRAADLAAAHGVTLLIEPLNARDRPGYFLTRAEQAADIIAATGRPNVKLQFDFYHAQIMGGDLIRRFEAHLPLIGHAQIAAVPSRREPDEGEVNYAEICRAVDAAGYAGFVAAEYFPRGRTEDGLGWLRAFRAETGPG